MEDQAQRNIEKNKRIKMLAIFFLLDLLVLGFLYSQTQKHSETNINKTKVVISANKNSGAKTSTNAMINKNETNAASGHNDSRKVSNGQTLANTGPGNYLAIFFSVFAVSSCIYYIYDYKKNKKAISDS